MDSSVGANGPLTLRTDSCPASPDFVRTLGKRPKEGRRAKIPVQAAGMRRDPPVIVG